jgi:hypothetical protein
VVVDNSGLVQAAGRLRDALTAHTQHVPKTQNSGPSTLRPNCYNQPVAPPTLIQSHTHLTADKCAFENGTFDIHCTPRPDHLSLIRWKSEQLHSFRRRQQFASRHRSPSRMARLSQLKYTLNRATLCHRKTRRMRGFRERRSERVHWDKPPHSIAGYRQPTRPAPARSGT